MITAADRVAADSVLDPIPGGWVMRAGLSQHAYSIPATIQRLQQDTLRLFPTDTEQVFGRRTHETEYRFERPDGWTVELPEPVR